MAQLNGERIGKPGKQRQGVVWPVVAVALIMTLIVGARGMGGGVASAVILGLGWTLLASGYAIVYYPLCELQSTTM